MQNNEVKKLTNRLKDMEVTNFHVSPGPEWNNITPEERAKELNKVFDAIENGDYVEVKNLDGSIWFPMPQISTEDWMAKGFKYHVWKVLDKLHRLASKIDYWLLWKKHKIKRFMEGKPVR